MRSYPVDSVDSTFRGHGILLLLFFASGLAALIYQSMWAQYLALLLGHAAYAQTLVLVVFMGGMALGAWWVSRLAARLRRPLLGYVLLEALIGLAGLAFHPVFLVSSEILLGASGVAADGNSAWPLYLGAVGLILPQSVLLGGTFPLLSSAALRLRSRHQAHSLGGLYFSNSLGAAAGALLATFLLLPRIGMPGAMLVAGALNLMVAAAAAAVMRHLPDQSETLPLSTPTPKAIRRSAPPSLLLFAAAFTAVNSFVYEIVWIRMLNQSLGTTLHSFEIMLTAFILGIALGAWWIQRRGPQLAETLRYAAHAQVLMGVCAIASVPVFAQSFGWMEALLPQLPRTDSGYGLLQLLSAGLAIAVMLPSAVFAGMTLPLFTLSALAAGESERAIGRIYAANTMGSVVGVLLAVHLLIPCLGLTPALLLAAGADIALGWLLYAYAIGPRSGRLVGWQVLACSGLVTMVAGWGREQPLHRLSDVYRGGRLLDPQKSEVEFLRDGKTASVGVVYHRESRVRIISTNGKPDAGLAESIDDPPVGDEISMTFASLLGLAAHPDPRQIAVVGWGSGLSSHVLLSSELPRQVDSIEIEPQMYEGARLFAARVARAYEDPRSRVHFEDARRYFATTHKRYDVILSIPSNPWVSGVASLFTQEFYSRIGAVLEDDGILVQWLNADEIDDATLARIAAALLRHFPHAELYQPNYGDQVLLASRSGQTTPSLQRLREPALRQLMRRVGIDSEADIALRRLAGTRALNALVQLHGGETIGHSDFFPLVALDGPRQHFTRQSSEVFEWLRGSASPIAELLDGWQPPRSPTLMLEPNFQGRLLDQRRQALAVMRRVTEARFDPALSRTDPALSHAAYQLRALSFGVFRDDRRPDWLRAVGPVAAATIAQLPRRELASLWTSPNWLAAEQPDWAAALIGSYRAAASRHPVLMAGVAELAIQRLPADAPQSICGQLLLIRRTGQLATPGNPAAATGSAATEQGCTPDSRSAALLQLLSAWR